MRRWGPRRWPRRWYSLCLCSMGTPAAVSPTKRRFDQVTQRFVFALTLLPIVPAVSIIGGTILEQHSPASDNIRWIQALFSLLLMSALLLIWRTLILWTLGKTALTALVSMIPFIQIIWNQPLWKAGGCSDDEILRLGQHQLGSGMWVWIAVWVWWGMEKTMMARQQRALRGTARRGTWLVPLGASIGIFPCVLGLFLIVGVFLESTLGISWSPAWCFWNYVFCGAFTLVAWCLIWRKRVEWSARTLSTTLAVWMVMVGFPIGGQFLATGILGTPIWTATINAAPVIGWGLWLAWTIWYWPIREGGFAGLVEGPRCLRCGYLLRGLKATRCPECGDEPTIDELWSASVSCA